MRQARLSSLTVQTAGITDFEGFRGSTGKTAPWIQFTEGDQNNDNKVDIADFVTILNIMTTHENPLPPLKDSPKPIEDVPQGAWAGKHSMDAPYGF